MTVTKRILLLLAIFFLFSAFIGGSYFYVYHVYLSEENIELLKEKAEIANVEAREFASNNDNEACVEYIILKINQCASNIIECQAINNIAFRACLNNSEKTPGFCDEVPSSEDFWESGFWRDDQCEKYNFESDICQYVIGTIQEYCHNTQ